MSKIQLAMVNTALTRGGAARMAASLVDIINQQSETVSATLYHCENREVHSNTIGLKRPISRQINAGLARLGGSYAVTDFGVADQLIKSTENADVLHVHNLHGYYLNFERLLLAWRDRPVVWTWHDMWGATGRCGSSSDCEKWKQGCPNCPMMNYYPAAWIDRAASEFEKKTWLYSQMKNITIVSPSQWLADIAVKRGFDQDNVVIVPNPVDTQKFKLINKLVARKELGLEKDSFTVLFLASDCGDERKGYSDFLKITSDKPWQAVAVGRLPQKTAAHITHAGEINDQSLVNSYYAAADVMVIPTYADNYPNTVIEALSSGTPVIGYDEGGVASQLDMPSCVVVEKGDWQAIRKALEKQATLGIKTEQLSSLLNAKANARWQSTFIVNQYIDIYSRALAGGR